MKSGPTLKPATRRPRSVKAAIRPVATVVLPTPEWVPATTTLAVIGSPSAWRSPLDSLLAADALVEGMLELAHLGDEVGDLDQRRGGVATGDDDVLEAGAGAQHDAERGGGLAFALAGVDDQQRVVPPGARDALAPGRGLPGISGHATRLFRGRLAAVEPGPKPTRAAEPPPGRAVVPVTARTSPASGWAASASSAMHGPLRAPARAAASPSRTTASSVTTTSRGRRRGSRTASAASSPLARARPASSGVRPPVGRVARRRAASSTLEVGGSSTSAPAPRKVTSPTLSRRW